MMHLNANNAVLWQPQADAEHAGFALARDWADAQHFVDPARFWDEVAVSEPLEVFAWPAIFTAEEYVCEFQQP